MVDLNITNFITVGLISVAAYAVIKIILQKLGYSPAWL